MKRNLLLVTEHYPCGTQEEFLETEIQYLQELFRVHVITSDTDRLMTRALPEKVTFSRPVEKRGGLRRVSGKLMCRFSRGYQEEKKLAKKKGVFTKEFEKHTLDLLLKSRELYDYIRTLDIFEREEPLLVYSANFNDELYGLCCLKNFSDDIRVVARCHMANMFDPHTGERRETINDIINRSIDAVYFTSEHAKDLYLQNYTEPDENKDKFQVARLGAPGQELNRNEPLPEFFLRIVTCCPIETDKRLPLIIEGLSMVKSGCVEWVHFGTGSMEKEVKDCAERMLGDKTGVRYRFMGKTSREEIYKYYRETYIDLYLSVSTAESVPSAMIEAMASHIFVVATNVDGVSDVVDNDNGMLLPPDVTAEQLGLVLEGFCHISKMSMGHKGTVAYQSWKDKFDSERNCAEFAELLALLSGQDESGIMALRKESHSKALDMTPRPHTVFSKGPAGRTVVKEMPGSFKKSLEQGGLLDRVVGKAEEQRDKPFAPPAEPEPQTKEPADGNGEKPEAASKPEPRGAKLLNLPDFGPEEDEEDASNQK